MSMTVTMNESGLVAVPESVRKLFGIKGPAQVELDLETDGVRLRFPSAQAGEDVPVARVEYRDGFPVIVGTPPLSDEDVVRAIKADRDDRRRSGA
jgi:bifunctional DNA-binding transcriptional regulator/antitoxin component of YhaV-PrlF toxin-antitoxin module